MSSQIDVTNWKSSNLAAINLRLAPLRDADKIEEIIQGDIQGIFLHREEAQLKMYCYDNDTQKLSNIMSRIDLNNPLNLVGPYSQAVFLSAFWQNNTPSNIYIAGFGGGRLAMLFDHHFPDASIDGSDIDPNVLSVAHDYFGLSHEALKGIVAADSREDIENRSELYDIIFLDVFVGGGEHVNHLSTIECFELYKSKLSSEGVVVANLVVIDERMEQKIAAMQTVFNHCYTWEYNGAHVTFASDQELDIADFMMRISNFQNNEKPDFDLLEKAKRLKPCAEAMNVSPLSDKDL